MSFNHDLSEFFDDLGDFDLDLVGFDCYDEMSEHYRDGTLKEWTCPFKPGCGVKSKADCPMMKKLATVIPRAPKRIQ